MARLILKPIKQGDIAIKGIVFDMDGTLCLPQTWMFKEMRSALEIDKSIDILDHVHALPPAEQQVAHLKLQAIEKKAMVDMIPQPGVRELMAFLESSNLPKSICTRNFPIPVTHLLTKHLEGFEFEPVITREFHPPKPHPAGILKIAKDWGVDPHSLIMVGDSLDDMRAGYTAGAGTILLKSDVNTHIKDLAETDIVINDLRDIVKLLETGLEVKEKPE